MSVDMAAAIVALACAAFVGWFYRVPQERLVAVAVIVVPLGYGQPRLACVVGLLSVAALGVVLLVAGRVYRARNL